MIKEISNSKRIEKLEKELQKIKESIGYYEPYPSLFCNYQPKSKRIEEIKTLLDTLLTYFNLEYLIESREKFPKIIKGKPNKGGRK